MLHLQAFDKCDQEKEGALEGMACMGELKGGLGVWKTWRVDTRWRKEKWHDSPCARLMSMPWRRRMGGMGIVPGCQACGLAD